MSWRVKLKPPQTLGASLGIIDLTAITARAQDPAGDLRAELNAIRQDYEKRITGLESRIEELEATKTPPPASRPRAAAKVKPEVSAKPEVAAEPSPADESRKWRAQAQPQFRRDTEIRDLARYPDAENPLDQRIEDIPLGIGKFAVAWIGDGAESAIYSRLGVQDPLNQAGFSKSNFDFRWYDWPLFGGTGELGLVYAYSASGLTSTGLTAEDAHGVACSLARTRQAALDPESLHKTALQIGSGPAKTFNSGFTWGMQMESWW